MEGRGSCAGRATVCDALRPSQPGRELLSQGCPTEEQNGQKQAEVARRWHSPPAPQGSDWQGLLRGAQPQLESNLGSGADAEDTRSVLKGHVGSTPQGLPRRCFVSL